MTWQGDDPAPQALMARLAETLASRLRQVGGSELVHVFGAVDEEIRVTLNNAQAADLGLSLPEIAQIIQQADSKTAAGTLNASEQQLPIEVRGGFTAIDSVAQVPLRSLLMGVMSGWKTSRSSNTPGVSRGQRKPGMMARTPWSSPLA